MNYSTRTKLHRVIISAIIITLCAVCFSASMMAVSTKESLAVTTGYVASKSGVNVRPTAGTDYDPKFALGYNEKVTILSSVNGTDGYTWYYISHSYGNGYIRSNLIYNISDDSSGGGSSGSGSVTPPQTMSDAQFEQYMQDQGFPTSYRPYLRDFHKKHPTWIFKAAHTNLDWNYVISRQSARGVNTVHITSPAAFRTDSNEELDSGGYVAASRAAIEYYMDPRNSFDNTFFQFLSNRYDGQTQTVSGINDIVRGTFLANPYPESGYSSFSSLLMSAGATYGVNPLILASKLINEHGTSGNTGSISGTVAGYEGYYNYFNIGAYAHGGNSAIINGLIYAKNKGWDSRAKSILSGTEWFARSYIANNMSTAYFQKFNVMNGAEAVATGQYMTAVWGANSTGQTLGEGYTAAYSSALTFEIPVYINMPNRAVPRPGSSVPNEPPVPSEPSEEEIAATELLNAKTNAKTALQNYKSESLYRSAQKAELQAAIAKGRNNIDGAADISKVNQALADAKSFIDSIPTDAQLTENEKPDVDRVFGNDRYETSFATANKLKALLNIDKFNTVVLANGENPADALSGTYLAYLKQAPVLLTSPSAYNDTIAYIRQNLVPGGEIIILGGSSVVPSVYEEVFEANHNITRLGGYDRFDTNIKILDEIKKTNGGAFNNELVISAGGNGSFADSLSASAIRRPVMLVDTVLNSEQQAYLENNFRNANINVIGGERVVSNDVYNTLYAYSQNVERIYGDNRFSTSNLIASKFFNSQALNKVYIASGLDFPDGLCAGVLASTENVPLLLGADNGYECNAFVRSALAARTCLVFGGTGVVSDDTVNKIMSIRID